MSLPESAGGDVCGRIRTHVNEAMGVLRAAHAAGVPGAIIMMDTLTRGAITTMHRDLRLTIPASVQWTVEPDPRVRPFRGQSTFG